MGRARGSQTAAATVGGTRRGVDVSGLGNLNPTPQSQAAGRVALLIDDVHRGDYDLALDALSRHADRLDDAPLVDDIMKAVCETAAAQVRAGAERQLPANRTAAERQQLRDIIAADIEGVLRHSIKTGRPVNAAFLRALANGAANRAVATVGTGS